MPEIQSRSKKGGICISEIQICMPEVQSRRKKGGICISEIEICMPEVQSRSKKGGICTSLVQHPKNFPGDVSAGMHFPLL
jgi:hypothetical protein